MSSEGCFLKELREIVESAVYDTNGQELLAEYKKLEDFMYESIESKEILAKNGETIKQRIKSLLLFCGRRRSISFMRCMTGQWIKSRIKVTVSLMIS